ncbi:MAG: GGDEF domain-containing response regulator [Deltaproteobacteria bacterium]|nr:GGDEF domain-containing response regulator [Deltaproteobacteria bacterium]
MRTVRVLLVGSNGAQTDRVRSLLESSTSTVFDVAQLDRLSRAPEEPAAKEFDVLLLDLGDAHPITELGQARELFPGVPVVLVHDDADEAHAAELLARGASGHLLRSELSPQRLVTTLVAACGQPGSAGQPAPGLATHDRLTGLPNAWLFQDRLAQALAAGRRHPQKLALLYLDLDDFRAIEAAVGGEAAAGLLRRIAERLRARIRETDTVARIGHDEFAVLLTHLKDERDAARVVAKIVESLGQQLTVGTRTLTATASIGIATFPSDGEEPEVLVGRAEAAMLRARQQGGGCYEFYASKMNVAVKRVLAIEARMPVAIAEREMLLHYQPQYDLRRDRIVGAEALVRWQHPELGFLAPNEFLPLAEESGWIVSLGAWVLREACQQAASWHERGHPGLRIGVNVASRQLRELGFQNLVRAVLAECGLRPESLELEITESALVEDVETTAETFNALKRLGVRISIDDFGTGYSSLSYLKRLPVDVLKIDRSFVRDVTTDPVNATITETIVQLARGLGLTTVAEGVETPEQLLVLGSYGCNRLQGFLFGRPVAAEVFEQWLEAPPFRWTEGIEKS